MSTLADELLQDFEDSGSEAGDDAQDDRFLGIDDSRADANGAGDVEMDGGGGADGEGVGGEGEDDEEGEDADMGGVDGHGDELNAADDPDVTRAKIERMKLGSVRDVRSVAGLSKTLAPVLEKISYYQSQPPHSTDNIGNIEDHPEYHLLTQSNSLSTAIDSEIVLVHKFVRDHYSVRFPELESLITNAVDYAKVVAILGNGPMDSDTIKRKTNSADNPLGVTLKSVLDGPSLMIVSVEGTTSKGREMSQEELERVIRACEMVISLDKAKKTLTEYVQSRMNVFAPNLTALIGSLTAAQLLNAAGGLTGLSKAPACNLPAWGSKKQASAALATNVGFRQQGYLFQSPTIRQIPNDLKKQAIKKFANKIVLCARMDCFHQFRDGAEGERLKDETLDQLDKLQQKPLGKGVRALPAPDDKPARKRGGRRARKAKEATAMTELAKQQNRMAFGREEKEVGYGLGDSTKGMGMIGQRDDGRLRAAQIDQRTRAKLSAKSKGWGGASSLAGGGASSLRGLTSAGAGNISLAGSSARGLRTSGVGTTVGSTTAGTVSSLAFTPMQGLELVDPKVQAALKRKREADEDRWFKGGTFTRIGGGGGGGTATATSSGGAGAGFVTNGSSGGGNGVFKKPDLPPSKKIDTGSGKTVR